MKKTALTVTGIIITFQLLAQAGPGGPPSPEIPIDGGIIAFLIAAAVSGAGLLGLGWKKGK